MKQPQKSERAKRSLSRTSTASAQSSPSRPSLPPVISFRGYQQRWIDDKARAKIMVKSARIGISFATGYELVEDCLSQPRTTWTVLSAGEAQAVEFVGIARDHLELMHEVAQLYDEPFTDALGESTINQHRIILPNQSRVIALACNPRTARGFPGNAVLNEFAHVQDSYAVWAAIMRQIALGHRVAIESTPYAKRGKFYDVAKDMGLAEGVAPNPNPVRKGPWSGHWVDVHLAAAEGCPIDPQEQRELMKDEKAFAQEFLNQFAEPMGAWLTMELIGQCEHDDATLEWPAGYVAKGPLYMGLDVARDHDLTVLWIDELVGDVLWTRAVIVLHAMPFFGHAGALGQVDILEPWIAKATRFAMDATGMGVAVYDWFVKKFSAVRVMGVNFAGQNDQGVRMKVDLAMRIKQRFERALDRIPRDEQIRQDLQAIRREPTSTGVKFDAPRIEIETPSGQKSKAYTHADRFWAKCLAQLAASGAPAAALASVDAEAERGAGRERGRLGIFSSMVAQQQLDANAGEEEAVGAGRETRGMLGRR